MMDRTVRAFADTFLCRLMACILRPLHASARSAQSSQSELRWVDTSSQQPQVLGSPPKILQRGCTKLAFPVIRKGIAFCIELYASSCGS